MRVTNTRPEGDPEPAVAAIGPVGVPVSVFGG